MIAKLNFAGAVDMDTAASNLPPPEASILPGIDLLQPPPGRPSPFRAVAV